jgi:DNA-binding CsgD family transcriptional regulator
MVNAMPMEPGEGRRIPGASFEPLPYSGPERRRSPRDAGGLMLGMLDEIDYGMLLVDSRGRATYMNHMARVELDGHHPLQLSGGTLRAEALADQATLADALAAAQRGLRKLITLGQGGQRLSVSVVPLSTGETAGAGAGVGAPTLLLLGKRAVCQQLSVRGFARAVGLTPAETRVLEWLCAGERPARIAELAEVKIATIRTQIGSIRAKSGAMSIRDLVRQIAVLPPLVNALRHAMPASRN